MKRRAILDRLHPRRSWSVLLVVALLATSLYFVFRSDGNIVPALDLHDAGIWVTNESSGRVGRTNTEIKTVDTTRAADASAFDLHQTDAVVVLRQRTPSRLAGINPATAEIIPGSDIPENAQFDLAGGTSAMFLPGTGELLVTAAPNSAAALGLDPSQEGAATATIDGPGAIAVDVDGLVHLLAEESGEITTWNAQGEHVATRVVSGDLTGATITAVGSMPVVATESELLIPDTEPVDLSGLGEHVTVQEPGPDTSAVLVAAEGGFVRVSLSGGALLNIDGAGEGVPAAPVYVAGCAYGAWGGDLSYVQLCDGRQPRVGREPAIEPTTRLKFRSNRGRVTLNNLEDGTQLLFGEDDPTFLDNEWAEALTDEVDEEPETDETADVQIQPECPEKNTEPVAQPDRGVFGTRAGVPVVVYPLLNDSDPDCDVLLIESVHLSESGAGKVGIVESGRAVQVELESGVDSLSFDYTIGDGRGGEASSVVTVGLVPENQNSPATLSSQEETTVVTGGTVTHNVLAPAYDPDGDVLRLTSATNEDVARGSTRFTEKGDITFTATDTLGVTEITYRVSDGTEEATGVLRVTVVDRNTNQPPNARRDSATTFVGREVVLDVLDNDTDPDGDQLSIIRVDTAEDASVSWDPTSPEIRVVADRAGTVNVEYSITDGQATDHAVFRIDVRDDVENLPPVAVRDDVLLNAGVPAYVPVVENDVDPDGAVLVVLGIDRLPDPSPITVTVLQRSVLKIETPTPLSEPVDFDYKISDGSNEAIGRVRVEPSPPDTRNRAPVAIPDEFTVRSGGIVALPVLANDSDPDADPITVVDPGEQTDVARSGRLFLSHDDQLRYEAPTTPQSTVKLIYSVEDTAHNVSSAEVIVHVLPPDENTNEAPTPPELVGRTIAGQPVTVQVPITSMDPDGDSVTFLGLGEDAPDLGTVTEIRPDEFVYVPDALSAGTDKFTYRVVDVFGQEATGTVVIGVAGRSETNNRPIPADDDIAVRPGATVRIPVLVNDVDPDGDPLTISTAEENLPVVSEGSAEVDGRDIVYTAPSDPEGDETSFRYVADDGRGLTRSATVHVTFRTDAENRPPDAIDDVIEPQAPEARVVLELLANDSDPDLDELTITEVSESGVTIAPDGRSVSLVMGTRPLAFTYLVSDGQATARAAVFVPVIDPDSNQPPIARIDEVEVDMGETVTIDVLANDEDPEGADVHLIEYLQPVRHGSVTLDENRVSFTASQENYAGDAGFYYLVGDTNDASTAQLTVGVVHVTINGTVNTPPEFTSLEIEVPAGSERALDLNSGVVDPDEGDDHSFGDLSVEGDGIDVDVDGGGAMTVSADPDTPPGTTGFARFTVADDHDEVEGSVRITVVSSDKPLAVVGPDEGRTVQTQPVSVNVLANDTNPFPATPLRILSAEVRDGGGSASISGATITYDPGPTFFGTATVVYRVADKTGDPNREVEGTLTVNVIGFPDPPTAPSCIGGESRTVRVQWAAPSANGAPITNYIVRVSGTGTGTGDRQFGNASTVDVGNLQNGAEYTFQIGAVNEAVTQAGVEPQFSAASPGCIPDQVPDQPEAPTTRYGDTQMDIAWTAPNNEGSDLQKFTLTNATTGKARDFGPSVTSHTWDGLTNGTCYRFTVTATNAKGPSDPSPLSAGDQQTCVPAGVPQNPSTPTITNNQPGQRDDAINVAWTWNNSEQGNGDDAKAFRITPYRNGVAQTPKVIQDGTARSTSFNVGSADYGSEYRFTLEAMNKVGWSAKSPQSAVIVPADVPGAPSQPSGVPEPNSGQVRLSFNAPPDNGAAITGYQVSINGGGWQSLASNRVISGLNNGTGYRFAVRALNSEGAGTASAQSNAVVPFGKIGSPTNLRGWNNGNTLKWSWSAPSLNGHNSVVRYQVSIDGGAWNGVGGSTSHEMTVADGQCRNLRVRAIGDRQGEGANDNRHVSDPRGPARACAPAPPNPVVRASWSGAYTPCDSNSASTCQWADLSVQNMPTGNYSVHCYINGNWFFESSRTLVVGPNGSGSLDRVCHVASGNSFRYQVRGPITKDSNTLSGW